MEKENTSTKKPSRMEKFMSDTSAAYHEALGNRNSKEILHFILGKYKSNPIYSIALALIIYLPAIAQECLSVVYDFIPHTTFLLLSLSTTVAFIALFLSNKVRAFKIVIFWIVFLFLICAETIPIILSASALSESLDNSFAWYGFGVSSLLFVFTILFFFVWDFRLISKVIAKRLIQNSSSQKLPLLANILTFPTAVLTFAGSVIAIFSLLLEVLA